MAGPLPAKARQTGPLGGYRAPMTGLVVLTVLVIWCAASTWWEWWLAARRRPSGERLAKLRVRIHFSRFVPWMLLIFGLVIGGSELAETGDVPWFALTLCAPAAALSALGSRASRRAISDAPRSAPPADLVSGAQRLARWRLPLALGFAAFFGILLAVGGEMSLALVLTGPVTGGVFMYGVLTLLLVMARRASEAARAA